MLEQPEQRLVIVGAQRGLGEPLDRGRLGARILDQRREPGARAGVGRIQLEGLVVALGRADGVAEPLAAHVREAHHDVGSPRLVALHRTLEQRWEDLAALLERAVKRDEARAADVVVRLADVRRERLGDAARAAEGYHQALKLDPAHAGARHWSRASSRSVSV